MSFGSKPSRAVEVSTRAKSTETGTLVEIGLTCLIAAEDAQPATVSKKSRVAPCQRHFSQASDFTLSPPHIPKRDGRQANGGF